MEKLILILCWIVTAHSLVSDFHHKLKKRQADLIDFNEQCTAVFSTMDVSCLTNIYSLVETYKSVEKEAVKSWGSQCQDNIYDCLSSPDGETGQVIEYFKVLLPQVKALCAQGCMVPIIDLIHSCLKQEALDEIGLSRSETEDIFDLMCIQEDSSDNGQEGEYCMIKAMTTASYLYQANQIKNCNLDAIDLTSCGQDANNEDCTCDKNCTTLMTSGNALMGCCMGTLLDLESAFNMSHPDSTDILNPGSQLMQLCGVTPGESCKTSKQVIADQKQQYAQCAGTLQKNEESECISLEKETHTQYLLDMQDINKSCKKFKNINQCRNSTAEIAINEDLLLVMSKLNNHCEECGPELAGIKDNCTVFLPEEAKMVFEMMCLTNSDMEHCGPRVIVYEAEQERLDLNSNPCFKGFMPQVQNQCSDECVKEVELMNKYDVLNCFDALMDHAVVDQTWQLWHKNCVHRPGVEVQNKINMTTGYDYSIGGDGNNDNGPSAIHNSGDGGSKTSLWKTVVYTFVGTVLLAFVVVGVVMLIYKRHVVLNMFGYNKFGGVEDNNLITDVHMEDTMGSDYDEDRGENYYD